MLPLRLMGAVSCGQDADGREVMATPERALLSTLRRDSLGMADTRVYRRKCENGANFFERPGVPRRQAADRMGRGIPGVPRFASGPWLKMTTRNGAERSTVSLFY